MFISKTHVILNQIGNDVGVRITYTITSPVTNEPNPGKWLPD